MFCDLTKEDTGK